MSIIRYHHNTLCNTRCKILHKLLGKMQCQLNILHHGCLGFLTPNNQIYQTHGSRIGEILPFREISFLELLNNNSCFSLTICYLILQYNLSYLYRMPLTQIINQSSRWRLLIFQLTISFHSNVMMCICDLEE